MDLGSFSLEGKTAIVTGCAGGIGQGIAKGLAKAGADIIGIDLADMSVTAEAVAEFGTTFTAYNCDLSDETAIDGVWSDILSEGRDIDILVNNAGMQYRESAYDYPTEVFDKIIDVNVRSMFLLSQRAANKFREQGRGGKIINIASLFTTFGGVNVVGYTVSKHGVMGLTRALSNEFAKDGICVNAIAPGYIATDLTKSIWSDPERRAPMDARLPIGRWGTPDDFAGPAVFLASSASDYITGILLPVDGGYTAR